MIIWLVFFLIVVTISFILAFRSMKDYQEIPPLNEYGIFLIQKPTQLTGDVLVQLRNVLNKKIISIERLFKGGKSALVIFGPKLVLEKFSSALDLLELEDYTNQGGENAVAWEAVVKNLGSTSDIFSNLPGLENTEQFWWQMTLISKKSTWKAELRGVVVSAEPQRRKELASTLQNLGDGRVVKVPTPATSLQIYENFVGRSFTPLGSSLELTDEVVLNLVGKS